MIIVVTLILYDMNTPLQAEHVDVFGAVDQRTPAGRPADRQFEAVTHSEVKSFRRQKKEKLTKELQEQTV